MIMCVLLCYPVSIHMSQLQATGRPISSFQTAFLSIINNNCLETSQNSVISYFLQIL